ncbi:MAG: hypothetical protein JWN99_3194, partial [Ilumatobacteraceae bacterium]|nr:hypothetical protein [Ilumatobacteraceae bacterium]
MSSLLYRIGRASARHRKRVVLVWLVAIVALFGIGKAAGGDFHDKFSVPGVESQKATDLLSATFPAQAGGSAQVVFHSTDGTLTDPANAAAMTAALDAMASVQHVVEPPPGSTLVTSADGTIALATVRFDLQADALPLQAYDDVKAAAAPAQAAGLQVEFGGEVPQIAERPQPSGTEAIGLLAAMVILLIAFG